MHEIIYFSKLVSELQHFGLPKDYIYESFHTEGDTIEIDNLNDLIRRIKQQDMDALGILYSEMRECVYGLAYIYTHSFSDADDIVQDTFMAVWNSSSTYKGGDPKAWIMKIARNFSLKCINKANRFSDLDENFSDDDFREKVNNTQMLENLLKNLDENEREIVLMYSYGFTHAEISKITGKVCSTVRWKYRNAIKKLIKLSGGDNQ